MRMITFLLTHARDASGMPAEKILRSLHVQSNLEVVMRIYGLLEHDLYVRWDRNTVDFYGNVLVFKHGVKILGMIKPMPPDGLMPPDGPVSGM